ncbi:MAG: ATP-dependent zinc metalloprotease FtsH [Neisseriaceae bacterium]|nr:MAG: ATP-dependent zinc metalloprotease FtsH [Neisseriaceae bacterium]
MNTSIKKILITVLVVTVLFLGYSMVKEQQNMKSQMDYSDFLGAVHSQEVNRVSVEGSFLYGYSIKGEKKDNTKFTTNAPYDTALFKVLQDNNVKTTIIPEERPSVLQNLFISLIPLFLLIFLFYFFFMRMQGGGSKGGGAFSFGKSKARLIDKDANQVTFKDVAGCDEAKVEVQEIVDYLKEPSRYQKLGGKVPHGVLMVGSPGTGKTLLAKAIAGEAKVPFYSISGSDFVEMFVGVGASRVRDMFEQAKKQAPCIIFIDEIDAVGRQRGAGLGGGNDEREQTLNQLLVEMDGIESNATIIVIAATNRPDVLDPALLRPGRFDRQVVVPMPDIRGREQVLSVHVQKIKVDDSVNISEIARGTPGFSGADLANLVNEAALLAGRNKKVVVDQSDFEEAKDKIYMGPERRSMVMHEDEKRTTAYHESGHAVVAESLDGTDPVHKVTIMPRGRALGLTWQLPERDSFSKYKDQLLNEIAILFGGRVAEELFVKRISTGASNDFERATKIAKEMVMRYGMSDLGPVVFSENQDEVFLGRSVTQSQNISESTMKEVDTEVRRILEKQYTLAKEILESNKNIVETMTESLMKWETIDRDQILQIMAGEQPSEPKDYSHNLAENQPDIEKNEENK